MAKYNEKDIPDSMTYPAGKVHLRVLSAKHSKAEEISSEHPLQVEVKFEILAHSDPSVGAGAKYTERLQLGMDTDPNAESPATRREFKGGRGGNWQRWLDLTKRTGVYCGDTEEEAAALDAAKPEVFADMEKREGGKGTKSEGKFFNGLKKYYEPGKVQIASTLVDSSKPAGAGATSGGTVPAKRHCDECNKDIAAKLWEGHVKRHESEAAAESEEE